jgi:hypothetical protein
MCLVFHSKNALISVYHSRDGPGWVREGCSIFQKRGKTWSAKKNDNKNIIYYISVSSYIRLIQFRHQVIYKLNVWNWVEFSWKPTISHNSLKEHMFISKISKASGYICGNSKATWCDRLSPHCYFFTMAPPAHSGPRPFIQFYNHFSQTVGLIWGEIRPSQDLYLNTGQHKHRINAYTNTKSPCLEWDSNPRSQRPSERRQFRP